MLRPYQNKIIDDVRREFIKGKKSVLIQLPTGGGKTILMSEMLKLSLNKGKRSFFIVHRRELIKQTIATFSEVGIKDFGVISAGFIEARNAPIQICSIQTLRGRWQRFFKPDLVAIDECHHCASKSYQLLFDNYPKACFVGLSATPIRLDGHGLGNYFDSMICGQNMKWLIDNKFLSPYKLYVPSTINMDGLHMRCGDFITAELNAVMDKPTITGDAIKHYRKFCNGKRAVVFASSIQHSKHIVGQFISEGIPAAHVDGDTDKDERDNKTKQFSQGIIKVLSNVDLFGEGYNLPSMEAVILLRPTASKGLYLQQVGRVLRYQEEKTAIILDHVGNCQRHGLPDNDQEWSLSYDKPKNNKNSEQEKSVKVCPKCFAAQFSGKTLCSYCGFTFPVEAREVEQKEGDLVEANLEILRKNKRKEEGRARTLEELIAIGKERGYKKPHAWAYLKMKGRNKHKNIC